MIRKTIFPRILLLCLLFCLVFVFIVLIQFSGRGAPRSSAAKKPFDLRDYTIAEAASAGDFNAAVSAWKDENFFIWNRQIHEQNNEDLVIGFTEESIGRSAYSAALAAAPAAFLNGNRRTHESAVFLGQLTQASRTLATADRERLDDILVLMDLNSPDLLSEGRSTESGLIEFLTSRGHNNYIEGTVKIIKSLDSEYLELRHAAGVFKGYNDWKKYQSSENPYSRLTEKACAIVSESLIKIESRNKVFIGEENRIGTEYNLYLAKELLNWAETERNEAWAGAARSIIHSVLSMGDSGFISDEFLAVGTGITESPASSKISTARLYRILFPGEYSPKALPFAVSQTAVAWAWTSSPQVSAVTRNNVLDISVNFPAGESHFMLIRGIRPFTRLQLQGLDWRADSAFERYNSSGWSYLANEQTLMVKLRHRGTTEHIVIYF